MATLSEVVSLDRWVVFFVGYGLWQLCLKWFLWTGGWCSLWVMATLSEVVSLDRWVVFFVGYGNSV